MKSREFNNDNVVNLQDFQPSKGKRLPSLEGKSDEEVNYRFARLRQQGTTTISVGDSMQLEVPNYAVEDAKTYLRSLDINQRREIEKNISERIEMFLEVVENSKNLEEGVFEHLMDEIHQDVVLKEGFNQLTVLER